MFEYSTVYTGGSLFSEKLSHSELDERALDALKEFNPDDAIKVLQQFTESSLEHVTNKSAFLCGQMKTFRQKSKGGGQNATPKGPDPDKIKVSILLFRQSFETSHCIYFKGLKGSQALSAMFLS